MLWSALLIGVLVYLGLLVLLVVAQPYLVYHPIRTMEVRPDQFGMPSEQVSIRTSDGVKLSAWFIPTQGARGTVILCHGNSGNISYDIDTFGIFQRLGFNTLAFDYRGYGESEGSPSERGTYRDAEAAWNYLVNGRNIPASQILVMGRSLGGPIAAWLAKEHPPRALILESTFTSVADAAASTGLFRVFPVRLLCRFGYRTAEYVREVKCPVLVIHSPEDELVRFELGRRLFDAANEPKEFLEISGTHNEGFITSGARYVDGLRAFLSKHVAGSGAGTGCSARSE